MNTFKMATVGLLALAMAGAASADTIRYTGSTALRKATYMAVVNTLTNPIGASIGGNVANNDMSGANRAVIQGTLGAGGPLVTYQFAWAGSVGGTQAAALGLTQIPGAFTPTTTWLQGTAATGFVPGNVLTPLTNNLATNRINGFTELPSATAAFDPANTPTAANSDVSKALYAFPSANLNEVYSAGVGVVQFYWVKGREHPDMEAASPGSYARFTNMTQLQAQKLLSAGNLPLSLFTGNAADSAIDVLLVGRNVDSGTRVSQEAEAGFGFGNGIEYQYQPQTPVDGVAVYGFVASPANGLGQAGGGAVATILRTALVSGQTDDLGLPYVFVAYAAKADKNTAVTAPGGVVLTWNGVDGLNDATTQNGAYTAVSFGHAYYLSSVAGDNLTALQNLATNIRNVTIGQSGMAITSMYVNRAGEGDRNPPSP